MGGEHTKLLDELLVLVHLLQGLNVHGINSSLGGLLNVLHISEHAHAELDLGDVGELDLSAETLVLAGVVVLQSNLELDSLGEDLGLPVGTLLGLLLVLHLLLLALLGSANNGYDGASQHVAGDLAASIRVNTVLLRRGILQGSILKRRRATYLIVGNDRKEESPCAGSVMRSACVKFS